MNIREQFGLDGRVEAAPGWMTQLCFWLFIIIALTDYLDGYLARRDGLVSAFGRIADPFVDKVMVLGTMIFLAVMPWSQPWFPAWIVVVVLAREFLVTGIRGYVESRGESFAADGFGKIKMVVQCFAIGFRVNCHRSDTQLLTSTNNPKGYFTSIRNKYFPNVLCGHENGLK